MKLFIVVILIAVCFSLTEAKHIRTKRETSKDLLSELDRELKSFLSRRDDGNPTVGPTPTGKKTHACEQEITEEIKNKVRNRGDEIIGAAAEMGRDIYFTAIMFAGIEPKGEKIDIKTGFDHLLYFLKALGIVAQTQRGEQYVGQLVQDSKDIAKISIDDPDLANHITQVTIQAVKEYAEENFPPPATSGTEALKRGQEQGDDISDRDKNLIAVMMMFCSFNTQEWKEVVTDIDQVIDDGLVIVKATSSLLRSMRVMAASERVATWGEMTMMGLNELSKLTLEGNQAKLDEAFDHAEKIREKVEKAIEESFKQPQGQAQKPEQQPNSENTKRILHGMSDDALMQFLNNALKLYQSKRK